MLLGGLSWGLVADAYGRRRALLSAAFLTFTCGILSAAAPGFLALVSARTAAGFGIGAAPIAYTLSMEFLPAADRGRWGMGYAIFWALGTVFEAIVAGVFMRRFGFRAVVALSALPVAPVLACAIFLPESPVWLAGKGRSGEAEGVLRRAARANGRTLPRGRLVVPPSQPAERPLKQMGRLMRPGRRAITGAVYFLWIACHIAYFGSVLLQPDLLSAEDAGRRCQYARPAPFRKLNVLRQSTAPVTCNGALPAADYMKTLWAATGELPGLVVSVFFVDWFGRRPAVGYFFLMCMGTFVVLLPCPGRVAETAAFFAARAASNGAVQTIVVYTAEVEATDVRSTSLGVASAMGRLGVILTPVLSMLLDNINFVLAVIIFSVVCLLGFETVRMLPVETTGRPLFLTSDELIDALQSKDVKVDGAATFANDTDVHPVLRFFRWRARIDGYALRDSRIVSSRERNV